VIEGRSTLIFILFFSLSFPYFPTYLGLGGGVVVVYDTVLYSVEIPILFLILVLLRNHSLVIFMENENTL